MTVIAIVAARDVGRMLTGCRSAVMTGATASHYLCMVHGHDRRPQVRRVAVFTHIRRLNMCRTLSRSIGAVVAARTVAGDVHMVEVCR